MLRYAITDRRLFPGQDSARCDAVVRQAGRLAQEGVEYLQVREKDLADRDLLALTIAVRDAVQTVGAMTRVLLNGPPELAAAAGVGVHLPFSLGWHGTKVFSAGHRTRVTSISCHSAEEVAAVSAHADVLLFAPVFKKTISDGQALPGAGLAALAEACLRAGKTPVLALGGITEENTDACLAAGAGGVAGIRLFLR